ncbi:hypothetical protein [Aestuariibacter salexigens]|uniref:hypothetical protein n=1 Tax=Aestuariibacter salexigens TaxID=226010 RepID=UPI0004257A94|nr:hypothetical protein [Aestuariibacter salexigens]
MFKTVIIFLEIAALVVVLRTPFAEYLLGDLQDSASEWMMEVSMVVERQELAELRDTVTPHLQNMRDDQKRYFDDVTSNKGRLKNFYKSYCVEGDGNPFIYGASLRMLCSEVRRSNIIA